MQILQLLSIIALLVVINGIPVAGVFMGAYWMNGDWNHPLLYASTALSIVIVQSQFLFWWWVTGTVAGALIALFYLVYNLHSAAETV